MPVPLPRPALPRRVLPWRSSPRSAASRRGLARAGTTAAAAALALTTLPLGSAAAEPASDEASIKIVGGRPTAAGAWPAQAALLYRDQPDSFQAQFCGGTLVAPSWVLTAAHCVDSGGGSLPAAALDVAVGVTDLGAVSASQRIPVAAVRIHEAYNSTTNASDIALLQLSRPVSAPPQPVAVPGLEPLQEPETPARIVGWGGLSSDQQSQTYPRQLQEADLPLVSDAECDARFAAYGLEGAVVPELMVCAGDGTPERTGVDTCQGDSGGPLLVIDPRIGWRQVGITSFGPTCGNSPTAYSELVALAGWVERTAGIDLNTYSDTGPAPFEAAVERAALLGVVGGFPDGTYRPTVDVTREQVASLLARALGVVPAPEDGEGGFPDVDGTHRTNVNALVRLGVINGFDDGTFRPRDPVRRDQMASLLARALQLHPGPTDLFADLEGNVHESNVGALVDTGVVNGYSDGTYRPAVPVARSTMAEFLVRALLSDGEVGIDSP